MAANTSAAAFAEDERGDGNDAVDGSGAPHDHGPGAQPSTATASSSTTTATAPKRAPRKRNAPEQNDAADNEAKERFNKIENQLEIIMAMLTQRDDKASKPPGLFHQECEQEQPSSDEDEQPARGYGNKGYRGEDRPQERGPRPGKCWSEVLHHISGFIEKFDGNEQKFKKWREDMLDLIKGYAPEMHDLLKSKEKLKHTLTDADIPKNKIQDNVKLYLFLKSKATGQALHLIEMSNGNGVEAWRKMCERYQRSSELLKAQAADRIMHPTLPDMKKMSDIATKIDAWDTEILDVHNKHGIQFPIDFKIPIFLRFVPDEFMSHILRDLDAGMTYEKLKSSLLRMVHGHTDRHRGGGALNTMPTHEHGPECNHGSWDHWSATGYPPLLDNADQLLGDCPWTDPWCDPWQNQINNEELNAFKGKGKGRSSKGKGKPDGSCFVCGSKEHQASQCPERRCYNCGEKGHLARSCPKPKGFGKSKGLGKNTGNMKGPMYGGKGYPPQQPAGWSQPSRPLNTFGDTPSVWRLAALEVSNPFSTLDVSNEDFPELDHKNYDDKKDHSQPNKPKETDNVKFTQHKGKRKYRKYEDGRATNTHFMPSDRESCENFLDPEDFLSTDEFFEKDNKNIFFLFEFFKPYWWLCKY